MQGGAGHKVARGQDQKQRREGTLEPVEDRGGGARAPPVTVRACEVQSGAAFFGPRVSNGAAAGTIEIGGTTPVEMAPLMRILLDRQPGRGWFAGWAWDTKRQ